MHRKSGAAAVVCAKFRLAGFITGAIIGIGLIAAVAFCTFTCGFGVALLAGLAAGIGASAILSAGEALGKLDSSPTGIINKGSLNVFTNGLAAAFATRSTTVCSKHVPIPLVAEGSKNVFINGMHASRKGDAITCGATISGGSSNVFIGGGTERLLPVAEEVSSLARKVVDGLFLAAGFAGGLGGLLKNAGPLTKAVLPCAAKYIAGFAIGEAVSQYVIAPVAARVMGGMMGRPVEVATGRKILLAQDEIDFIVQSPIPVTGSRFYGSNLKHEGTLGAGWVLPWDLRLQQRDGKVWFMDDQGRETGFPLVQPGQSAFSDVEQCYLACTIEGQYILYDLNEMYYDFGFLDPAGDKTAWVRQVENRFGQGHAYLRDERHRVKSIHTNSGQRLHLHYTDFPSRLTTVECVSGGTPGTLASYGYDDHGQLISVTDANGDLARQFSYIDGVMESHTNALGFKCSYEWAMIEGQARVVTSSTSEGEKTRFHYDTLNHATSATDELGRQAYWTYDQHFQIIACMDFDRGLYTIEYNDAGMPNLIQLPGDRKIAFEYDDLSRIVRETDALGRVTHSSYDRNTMRLTEVALPDGSRWRAEYDYFGRLAKNIDPLGRQERYEYGNDLNPMPLAHIDARGGRQLMEWNLRGLITAFTDCSGKTTHYQYDLDGQLASTTNALQQTTIYTRRRTGEPVHLVKADGSTEEFRYDAAGFLVEQRNSAGQYRSWVRNARGQIVDAVNLENRALRYRYDARGRLVELASDANTRYAFEYDDGDRLAKEIRPDGVERILTYDAAGGALAIKTIGAIQKGEATADREHRTTLFERDKMGRLSGQITDTATCHITWSETNRLLEATRIPSPAGLALGIAKSSVRFDYDQAGRLVAEHGSEGTVAYTLDELNNVTQLNLPHNQQVETLTYGSGHVHQIRSADHLISDFERDDLHREVLHTQGELTQRIGYDKLGRRTWQSSGLIPSTLGPAQGQLWRSYRYHASGELAEQHDSLRGSIGYQYDPAGQLQRQTRAEGQVQEQFAWDAAGNLLDDIKRKSAGQVDGNRLKVWQDLRFEYDPWGNLSTKRKGAHQIQRFTFDAENRLVTVTTENLRGTTAMRFDYDPLGRRISSTETISTATGNIRSENIRSENKRFVWQGLRMVQEVRASGVSSYVYSPDALYTPLARIDAAKIAATAIKAEQSTARRIYHFHTNLVGAPLEVTDEVGNLAWAGNYQAWGKVEDEENSSLSVPIEQPLRFSGQYSDESTGLHYNTFRYYDPDIGRFISQDPIGLAGGANMYAYAPNPTGWMDPLGWCSTALGKNIGAKPGDGLQNHHLIPEEIMKDANYSAMFDKLRSLGFKDDGAPNGILLPGSSALAKSTNIPGHWSSHNQYTAEIEKDIIILESKFRRGILSDKKLSAGIAKIQSEARNGLMTGKYIVDAITGRLL
ncbi:hypothetical protein F1735_32315 [Massilia sp. CCM 8694]|uniref:Type IV secretion protein Rhs n=1 Tax=Massilia genomosp. 1 TaxID=2609280 RepID=A0ABX0N1N0_9BURK|nr:hypothetical protein [Massilia genomosp. 1]